MGILMRIGKVVLGGGLIVASLIEPTPFTEIVCLPIGAGLILTGLGDKEREVAMKYIPPPGRR